MISKLLRNATPLALRRARTVVLSGGGLVALVVAGFMFQTIVGVVCLGVALMLADYSLDSVD